MRSTRIFFTAAVLFWLITQPIMPHGLGAHTLIWTGNRQTIQEACEELVHEHVDLFTPSYDVGRGLNISRGEFQQRIQDGWVRIKGAARSVTNCYMRITLGSRPNETILCTPTQEFYVPALHGWVPAIDLEPGDELLSQYSRSCSVLNIELIMEQLPVYAISVEAPHTYFVSIRGVITHNMVLPAIDCAVNVPWDMVFTAGGQFALQLGPATCGISVAVAAGAGIGYAIYRLTQGSWKMDTYAIALDTEALTTYFGRKSRKSLGSANSSSEKGGKGNGNSGGGGGGAPRDPKDPKKRNTDKVGNMYELFARAGFGTALKQIAEPTKRDFQGAKIFRAMSDLIEYGIKKGDQFYLDMFHKDHVEVFNKLGEVPRTVLRLDGSVDYANLAKVIKEGRSV